MKIQVCLILVLLVAVNLLHTTTLAASATSTNENLRLKFEPWLWDKLQILEAEALDSYISLIIRSLSHKAKIELGEELRTNPDAKDVRILKALPVVLADVRVSTIKQLASNPSIKHVGDGDAQLVPVSNLATQTVIANGANDVQANVATIGANTTWAVHGANGSGITIAILDTGIDATHPDLDDLDDDPTTDDPKVVANVSFVPGEDADDYHYHGTMMAGIAAGTGFKSNGTYIGAAPGAKLANVKVCNSTGVCELEWFMEGIDWVIANAEAYNIKVVSISLALVYYEPNEDDGTSELCLAVDKAVAEGLVVAIAQGNVSSDEYMFDDPYPPEEFSDPITGGKLYAFRPPGSPAAAFNVISVGASDDKGTADFADDTMWIMNASYPGPPALFRNVIPSRSGPTKDKRDKPDVVAPGVNIVSCRHNWEELEPPVYYRGPASGTSASAPLVAGAAALILQKNPTWTPEAVKEAVKSTAELNDDFSVRYNNYTYNNFPFGAQNIRGEGLVNVTEAIAVQFPDLTVRTYTTTGSEITGVTVWVNGREYASPVVIGVVEGTHNVVVPSEFLRMSYRYTFQYWENNSTSNSRSVYVSSNRTITAYYLKEFVTGCPYVYVWNGTHYVIDNNLLAASAWSGGEEVEDYYKLEQSLVPMYEGNLYSLYSLKLGEFQQEHSYIDQTGFTTVDHDGHVKVAVSPFGEILTYQSPSAPVSAVDDQGNDQIEVVQDIDNLYYESYNGSYLTLDFGEVDAEDAKLILRADPPDTKLSIHVQVLDSDGNWIDVVSIIPRAYWATEIIDLSSYLPSAGGFKVRLYFTYRHRVDYVGLDTTPQAPINVQNAHLLLAYHSDDGVITAKLLSDDDVYAELEPGEQIWLLFVAPSQSEGQRSFITYTKGYYFTIDN